MSVAERNNMLVKYRRKFEERKLDVVTFVELVRLILEGEPIDEE